MVSRRQRLANKAARKKQVEMQLEKKQQKDAIKSKMSSLTYKRLIKRKSRNLQLLKQLGQLSVARRIKRKYRIAPKKVMGKRISKGFLSPVQTLSLFSKSKITRVAHRLYSSHSPNFATEYMMRKLSDSITSKVEYVNKQNVVILKNITSAVEYRLKNIPAHEKMRLVLSGDKGFETTKITLMFPDRSMKPQSPYNHLIIAVWKGNDNHENLKQFQQVFEELKQMKTQLFVTGDLSFLASLYGLSNASTFPCIWCHFRVNKKRNAAGLMESFDRKNYQERTIKDFEARLKVDQKFPEQRISVFRKYVWPIEPIQGVPPSLHLKLGIRNAFYKEMEAEIGSSGTVSEIDDFYRRTKKLGFVKSYKADDLNGPKLKKFYLSANEFKGLISSPRYILLLDCLDAFAKFAERIGSTKKNMDDNEIEGIIEATNKVLERLKKAAIGGKSVKVHVALKHVPLFLKQNRCPGSMSEEGLESLHSMYEQLCRRIQRSNENEILLYAARKYAVNVILFDSGYLDV